MISGRWAYEQDRIGRGRGGGLDDRGGRHRAATGNGAAPPLIQWDKIEIKTTDLGQNTYMLEGQGGNITVAVGGDGIIMVDSQFAPLSDKIKAAIRAISPLPVRYLVNTHFHGDHTGGNESFAKDGVVIVAHDNIRVRLAAGTTAGLTGAQGAAAARRKRCPGKPISADRSIWRSAAARRGSPMSPTPTPTATPGSISPTPTCSPPATP